MEYNTKFEIFKESHFLLITFYQQEPWCETHSFKNAWSNGRFLSIIDILHVF